MWLRIAPQTFAAWALRAEGQIQFEAVSAAMDKDGEGKAPTAANIPPNTRPAYAAIEATNRPCGGDRGAAR